MRGTIRILTTCGVLALALPVRAQAPQISQETEWERLLDRQLSAGDLKTPAMLLPLLRVRQDVLVHGQAAQKALAALNEEKKKHEELLERIRVHRAIRDNLGSQAPETDPLLAADEAALGSQVDLKTLTEDYQKKHDRYLAELERYAAYVTSLMSTSAKKSQPVERADSGDRPSCSLEEKDIDRFDPVKCARGAGGTPTLTSLPNRVLDRRGLTAQLTASGDSTTAGLKFTDTINFRRYNRGSIGITARNWNLAYSLGVVTEVKEGKNRLGTVAEDDKLFSEDRLDPGTKFQGSLSANFFPRRNEYDVRAEVLSMARVARAACLADQQQLEPKFRTASCTENSLIDWIFALDRSTGGYAHQSHVDAYNKAFWGSPTGTAIAGGGLSWEFGHPDFEYLPVDLANLPANVLTLETIKQRRWEYSISAFGFARIPWSTRFNPDGVTLIPAVTYKRDFTAPDKVTICPPPSAGAVAVTNQGCKTVRVMDGTPTHGMAYSLELRTLFPSLGIIPGFGVAPKYTYDTSEGNYRNSVSVPVWLAFEKSSLNGGLNFAVGWGGDKLDGTPKKDDWGISIFLGKTFTMGSGR